MEHSPFKINLLDLINCYSTQVFVTLRAHPANPTMLSGVISAPESDVGIWRVFTKVTRNSPFSGPQVLGAVLRTFILKT